jgi:hypothetical protein
MSLVNRRRSSAITALAVVALAAVSLVAAPAHAGDFNVTHDNLNVATASSCATIPLTWNAMVNPDAQNWGLDGDVINAAGASVHFIYEYEQAAVTTVTDTFTLCGLAVGANTFRLAVTAQAYDWTDPYTGDRTLNIDELFTVTYTPPPPPPPPPPPTDYTCSTSAAVDKDLSWWTRKANVAALDMWVKIGQSNSWPCDKYTKRTVKIQARTLDGPWITLRTYTGKSTFVSADVNVDYKYRKVRALVVRKVMTPPGVNGKVIYVKAATAKYRVPRRP